MYASVTHRCQQGDRLKKYFLAFQRKGPLTAGLRHRKSSLIFFHALLSLSLSFSLSPNSSCSVKRNWIIIPPCVAQHSRPHFHTGYSSVSVVTHLTGINLQYKPAQYPEQPHWTLSSDTSLNSNSAVYLCDSAVHHVKYYKHFIAFIVKYHRHPLSPVHTLSLDSIYIFFHQKQSSPDH